MYLGLDLGTSALKALLIDEAEVVRAEASVPLEVARPQPGWSEQDPAAWIAAAGQALDALARTAPAALAAVRGIGLSGQMHGAVLLGADDRPLRPAILWNDGRASAECAELEATFPDLRAVTGNAAMPGFTAPKLLWVRRHEPQVFAATRRVLLPKATLRLWLTGEAVEEMSDAAGTLWLDTARRDWSDPALAATGLARAHMPRLVEGNAPAGRLRAELAARWGLAHAPVVAGGAGDNAATAVGLGASAPGDAFLSLGTSGVLWATTDRFRPAPQRGVHAFCHALPERWHQMAVILAAGGALAWWSEVTGLSAAQLLAELPPTAAPSPALFVPYLSGERTPHNDATVRGAFLGLDRAMGRPDLTRAVLEGVAFAFRDGLEALAAAGTAPEAALVVGGGARAPAWTAILAAALNLPLSCPADAQNAAALGAARLGRMAATGEPPADVCRKPALAATVAPDPALARAYAARAPRYRAAYPLLRDLATPRA